MDTLKENRKWKNELREAYRNCSDLPATLIPTKAERAFFKQADSDGLQFLLPAYYFSLMERESENENSIKASCPLRKQAIPAIDETIVKDYELIDPLGETKYSPVPRLIHRYYDRVLFLTTDMCAMYCRHCFRRYFTGKHKGPASEADFAKALEYVSQHKQIKEIIFSGGDPLTLEDQKIETFLSMAREKRNDLVLRIASRMPVVLPSRITQRLVNILSIYGPIYLITQFNHPHEISSESIGAVQRCIDKGIPVLNQAVLLKDVNDDEDVLAELFQTLVRVKIKPYYLFHGDLAPGTSHFRVSLEKGFLIMSRLRKMISGLAMPNYAVDLPGGGGKIELTNSTFMRREKGWYYFNNYEGQEYRYPDE